MIQFLLGLVVGIVAGALGYRFWDEIVEKMQEARDRVTSQDPEDVQKRMGSLNAFARKYALFGVIGLLIVCIVGTVLVVTAQPQRAQLGGFKQLADKCGEMHNVQILEAHVAQGFVLVATGECELKYPLRAP